uniref:Uncharacterized protein n=1 Tax=Arundo donax TaxID=35708 RepID=A0A0A8YUG4_ARUDO
MIGVIFVHCCSSYIAYNSLKCKCNIRVYYECMEKCSLLILVLVVVLIVVLTIYECDYTFVWITGYIYLFYS